MEFITIRRNLFIACRWTEDLKNTFRISSNKFAKMFMIIWFRQRKISQSQTLITKLYTKYYRFVLCSRLLFDATTQCNEDTKNKSQDELKISAKFTQNASRFFSI